MRRSLLSLIAAILFSSAISSHIYGQGGSTSSLTGSVADPTGAVIPGAQITIKNKATGAEFRALTASNGTFAIPALDAGTYTVTISAAGFKQAIINDVKLDAGVPGTVRVSLDVGNTTESVVVQGGGEIVQTQTANITTTLNTKQIANLPLVSRNPLNFITLMPGVSTPGQNRDSTINGLPQSTIDITLDGINIQDNFNKTTDGFFTRVPPSIDSIQEVTVSTATPDAMGGAMGASQIKFITRQGSNEYHGSAYWYHRNPVLNSAYWFTNRDTMPVHDDTGLPCNGILASYDRARCHAPRARVLFNQLGANAGGPITIPKLFKGRDKAFFFVNYEEFRQPLQVNRTRTILDPRTQAGVFQYNIRRPDGTIERVEEVDLLDLATRNGQISTIDPLIGKLLTDIRNAAASTGGITQLTDPNLERLTYNPSGFTTTKRPTVRFDFNLTEKHHLETSWTYQTGRGGPDFLNDVEPKFPGFPNQGSQPADRYTGSLAVRSTLTPTLVNEARTGLSGGPSRFNPGVKAEDFTGPIANQNGFNLGGAPGNNDTGIADAAGIHGPTSVTAPSRRNPLLRDFSDTLTWTKGAHSLTFGGKFTEVVLTYNQQTLVPTINFGVNTNDPADDMFTDVNFPGASGADINRARGIYAVLTGRVIAINSNVRLDEETGDYVYLGNGIERGRQREYGFFAQDSWRVRPNLTLNYGLRWEVQGPFTPLNNSYTTTTVDGLYGISGPGNMFNPFANAGRPTQFAQFRKGEGAYNTDYTNFAPSFGFAWSPSAKDGWLKRIIGESGQTVLRGGYSIAYSRQGIGDFRGDFGVNPGILVNTNRDLTIGNLASPDQLPVLLRNLNPLDVPDFLQTPNYPLVAGTNAQPNPVPITSSANIYDPNIKVPYAQSWSFGIQREITKNMAIEVRYVGTRYLQGWTTYDLNDVELNIVENGLLNEFRLAQANLQANIAAGRCPTGQNPTDNPGCQNNFRYFGPGSGTSPLPITLKYFSGARNPNLASSYTSGNFANTNLVNALALNNPNVCCSTTTSYAGILDNNGTFRNNAFAAGLPVNFMRTNPHLRGGANVTGNGGYTRFDAVQVDLRRRLSRGLEIGANYQFAKGFDSELVSFRTARINALNTDLVRHAFKVNWVYELPIGRGKMLLGNTGGLLGHLIGGWEFHGAGRVQSGQLFNFGSVNLVGMTMKDLQEAYKLRFDDEKGVTYILPQDIIDNTIKAFSTSATSPTGYGSGGPPTGRYFAPASGPNCIQVYDGQCAPANVYVTGPKFTRFDLNLMKKFKFNERFNFELRAEVLNAFNNINFLNLTGDDQTSMSNQRFGQVTTAYTDSSNTQDPGGRLIQIVLRFNF
jgi:hypothetical protein